MGLFSRKKDNISIIQKKGETKADAQYINNICQLIGDNVKFLINAAQKDEWFVPHAENAMAIFNEATDITKKTITALKEYDIKKSSPLIKTYVSRIDELFEKTTSIIDLCANRE